ncbi:helix-turn-helix domain-containing protein [Desulforamulus aquiferis]|uniref:Helix-turn-helix transcriptional regulator n=1 Tax=Desulforamulus aquiferis TaxID=1397668 RepID=A0AAW7Z786_9FIRM|nr:helix-turn-helix transcriptional regulator [Desulforamulus aquiferis]MDO7785828.1 helix-turn-helix transcriptional regulator [Desulforamulus aquiferis]
MGLSILAKNLKHFREAKGLSQNQLAKNAGMAQSAVHFIENGKRDPGTRTLQKLAKALGVSEQELLSELEDRPQAV